MKKTLLFLIGALSLISLAGCGGNTNTNGGSSSSQPVIPDIPLVEFPEYSEEDLTATVSYYASASFATPDLALAKGEVVLGGKLPKPNYIPQSPDGAYNKFVGWSLKLYAMSDDDIWDFDNDVLPHYVPNLVLSVYGQWDYVE